MTLLLAVLLSSAGQFRYWRNICFDWPFPAWNPRAGIATVQGFCGPPDGSNIPFQISIDGKSADVVGQKLISGTFLIYDIDKPDPGLVTYITSHEYVLTAGPHTVTVKYGAQTVSYPVIGAVCDPALDGVGFDKIPQRPWVRGAAVVDCRR